MRNVHMTFKEFPFADLVVKYINNKNLYFSAVYILCMVIILAIVTSIITKGRLIYIFCLKVVLIRTKNRREKSSRYNLP